MGVQVRYQSDLDPLNNKAEAHEFIQVGLNF